MAVKKIPDGYHTATPVLIVRGGKKAIDFYTRAFGATVKLVMPGPNDLVMHAELQIGDSIIMLGDESPQSGKSPETLGGVAGSVFLYVDDCDRTFKQAIDAGAKSLMAPENMFWGDRYGKLVDPFGHQWALGTHIEDVTDEEMQKRMAATAPVAQ